MAAGAPQPAIERSGPGGQFSTFFQTPFSSFQP
jgi:hypothetical protein